MYILTHNLLLELTPNRILHRVKKKKEKRKEKSKLNKTKAITKIENT